MKDEQERLRINSFSFCLMKKTVKLSRHSLNSHAGDNSIILDFFPASGTSSLVEANGIMNEKLCIQILGKT